jgi:hypothetical protein
LVEGEGRKQLLEVKDWNKIGNGQEGFFHVMMDFEFYFLFQTMMDLQLGDPKNMRDLSPIH